MATSKTDALERAERQIRKLNARTSSQYKLLERIHSQIGVSTESFMSKSSNIECIRREFIESINEIVELELMYYPDREPDYDMLEVFEERFAEIQYRIKEIIGATPEISKKQRAPVSNQFNLPRLELPSFNGEIETWEVFYETFRTIIHENDSLNDSQRIQYLLGKLSGKALNMCRGILPTGQNYNLIWKALCDKFNDRRALAVKYLTQLFGMPIVKVASPTVLENFVDQYSLILSAIKQLNIDDLSEFIFVHLGLKCLDIETVRAFEMSIRDDENLPSSSQLINFVREQYRILARADTFNSKIEANVNRSRNSASNSTNKREFKTFVNLQDNKKCLCCGQKFRHFLGECPKFNSMFPKARFEFVKSIRACIKCLSLKHYVGKCRFNTNCKFCMNRHHSLLHFGSNESSVSQRESKAHPTEIVHSNLTSPIDSRDTIKERSNKTVDDQPVSLVARACIKTDTTMLLGTALCNIVKVNGGQDVVRVLVDSASQKSIITLDCCKRLSLPLQSVSNTHVTGLGGTITNVKGLTRCTLQSRFDKNISLDIHPYVVNCITAELPTALVDYTALSYFDDLPLADNQYYKPGSIDAILGCDVFARILLPGKFACPRGEPIAIETSLGYLILGKAPIITKLGGDVTQSFCTIHHEDVGLARFFELEDIPNSNFLTPEELECERLYQETTSRDKDGRYVIALPFRQSTETLGISRPSAERRFLSLERRLLSNSEVKLEYDKIFREYLELGYISPCSEEKLESPYYTIPHHAVIRNDKGTKVRVVLDASMKTDSGYSLNDILYTGKNLQSDLFRIILNFRLFEVAISADIRQMYLQIIVQEKHRRFQRVLYRFNREDTLQEYQFNRVTFGMTSSPFIAMRTIRQLASDERENFPLASAIIEEGALYMDDLALSCRTTEEATIVSKQLIELCSAGGFELVKFASNSATYMARIPPENRLTEQVEFSPESNLKILGLHWVPASDEFIFSVSCTHRTCTKRNILSTIARFWDLMGFVAPVILLAKLIVKSLWERRIDWDEIPPRDIVNLWKQFEKELPLLQTLKIPRHVGIETEVIISLLGFADASERAYGGVVYLHAFQPLTNKSIVSLLCAKSKVAPVKSVSLARLELCGALVLSQLMHTITETYSSSCNLRNIFAFSDSTVALSWIYSSPARWHTFVANRVAKIQENLSPRCFHYIKGSDNPADCLSRGLMPAQILDHPLWFKGPSFAYLPLTDWPLQAFDPHVVTNLPEVKTNVLITTGKAVNLAPPPLLYDLASRVSSWKKLIRITIYIFRFVKLLPRKLEKNHFDIAEMAILRAVQQVHFEAELKLAHANKILPKPMLKLSAFVQDGLLRVGGRLNNSNLNYEGRHPILLPGSGHVVELLVDYYHQINLHTGPALLMSLLRQRYWILAARNLVRRRVHKCNTCFKVKPKPQFPLMGELPAYRVREAKPFLHTGVDYAGPLMVLPHRRRGARSQKAYICLFICLVTHAVHIELASDLSTEVFLNAFKRFLSRRGPVGVMYSDCGTNFVGAKSYLKELYSLVNSPNYRKEFSQNLHENRVEWKFNPANSPHHGGIWESNIKGVKTHLNKIVGAQLLTFEEMLTVLSQIEALLNSRPLSVLSSEPSDPLPLTPAHFLTLAPLNSLPAVDLTQERLTLLQRKHIIDHLVQTFWKRWNLEYLNTLQSRQKWNTPSNPVKVGTVVLLKNENSPPLHWPLGIVTGVFPGTDGVIRVADVKTNTGLYRRAVVKLCPLPTQ